MNEPAARRQPLGLLLIVGLTIAGVVTGSAAGLWVQSTRPVAAPTPTLPAPASRPATALAVAPAGEKPARALLLTLAGARADFVEPYLADGTMRNLALLASSGAVTEYLLGVEPAASVVSHMSLACGSRPRLTGIVGERYRPAGQALERSVDASQGIEPADSPVWAWQPQAGEAGGVAVLFWPGGRGAAAAGAAAELHLDEGLTLPQTHTLALRRPTVELAGLPTSYSPPLAATASIQAIAGSRLATLWAAALDSRDDAVAGYDTILLGLATDASAAPPQWKPAAAGAWLVLALPGRPTAGVAFRPTAIERDAAGGDAWRLTVYQSGASQVVGAPAALADDLAARLGPPAPAPDLAGLRAGALALGDYLALAEQRAQWQIAAIGYVQERISPRLTLATLDLIASISSAALQAPPANIYDPALRAAYRVTDQSLGRLVAGMDLAQTTVLVGSPHGMAWAGTALNLGAVLQALAPAEGRKVAATYSSGGTAHIVFNLASREPQGTITQAEFDRLVPDLVTRLTEFKLNERPAFGRVSAGAGRRDLGLDHPNSGDIVVEAAAGIFLVDADPSGAGRLSWPATEVVAGYGARRLEMRGIFVLAGRGVLDHGMISPIELVDLAPTVADLVGLQRPAGVEGRVLRELLVE